MNVTFSKNQVMLGQQCKKAIWLDQFHPDLRTPHSQTDLFRFEQGNQVDRAARQHFAPGVLIDASDWDAALLNTRQLIEAGHPRLFQAAFEHNGIRIRTDILDLLGDGTCALREVKMSTSQKDYHLLDIAIQLYVLEGEGLQVTSAGLVHINRDYVAGGTAPLFQETEVTEEVRRLTEMINSTHSSITEILDAGAEPDVPIGAHCSKPFDCAFKSHCWQDVPRDSIFTIPRLHHTKRTRLIEQGILGVREVPDDFELTAKQAAYVNTQKSRIDKTDKPAIRAAMQDLEYPLYFLDFETFSTPVPTWAGVQANQQVPFQFSCHVMTADGACVATDGYLHTTFDDPRRDIAEALTQQIGNSGSILVYYQSFEKRVLEELAAWLPAYAPALQNMVDRLFDQYVLVKKHVHHPDMLGQNSLKTVSDILLDRVDYHALDIREGAAAQAEWYTLFQLSEEEQAKKLDALRAYCHMDTFAQVELHRWFLL